MEAGLAGWLTMLELRGWAEFSLLCPGGGAITLWLLHTNTVSPVWRLVSPPPVAPHVPRQGDRLGPVRLLAAAPPAVPAPTEPTAAAATVVPGRRAASSVRV